MTQETDRTYGRFKSQYRANLEMLVNKLVKQDKPLSVPQHKHGLLVFGGVDPETDLGILSAFAELGFSRERCLESWRKIGAVPLTRLCLDDPQVRKSIDFDKEYALLVNSVQEANEYAVYSLTEAGYDGSQLQAVVAVRPADARSTGPITQRMSKECIELLARANTHGKKFFATGGSHVCSDDFFKAQSLLARDDELAEKEALKKTLQHKAEIAAKGMAIVAEKAALFETNNYKDVSSKELDVLMQWYDVEKRQGMKKPDKVAVWKDIRLSGKAGPVVHNWNDEDEQQLMRIKNREVDMSETYLGRYAALQKRNAVAAVLDFTNDEWDSLKRMREADSTNIDLADDDGCNFGALGAENGADGGELVEEAV